MDAIEPKSIMNNRILLGAMFGVVAGIGGGTAFLARHATIDVIAATVVLGASAKMFSKLKGLSDEAYTCATFGASMVTAAFISHANIPTLIPSDRNHVQAVPQEQQVSFVKRTVECLDPSPVIDAYPAPRYKLPARCVLR